MTSATIAPMDVVELRPWSATAEHRDRFEAWTKGLIHDDFVDVRNRAVHFTPLRKPLAESRVALVSTGGIRLRTQRPFDVLRPDGDWSIRAIPSDSAAHDIRIDHTHYNHGDADDDVNCMFPIDRVRELIDAGFIGGMTRTFFGMMGFIPNGRHVVEEAGPELARCLSAEGTDVVFLTPS